MTSDTIAVSIHGPMGVLDLVVPPGIAAADIAREYAEQSGLGSIPLIYSASGRPLRPDAALADLGVRAGSVLVATTAVQRAGAQAPTRVGPGPAGPAGASVTAFLTISACLAVVAAWFGGHTREGGLRDGVLAALLAATVVGVVPLGRYAEQRVLAAPAFAGAAAFLVVWDPLPERLPMIVGLTTLSSAVAASIGRSLSPADDEGLRVWIAAGAGVFLLCGAGTLLGLGTTTVFSVLLVVGVLAARFVPLLAIDVPDQYLIDLERLAVTAWSAREKPRGRRGRTVVSPAIVADVASRGARTVTAACAAIAVVTALSASVLQTVVEPELDRLGARLVTLFGGAALLLAGRSYRHRGARWMLRLAGLACWTVLGADLLGDPAAGRSTATLAVVGLGAVGLGVATVVAGVATGRGWRSVWWSRRAEVAEGLCAAAALACLVLSSGLFRTLWEMNP